MQVYSAEQVRQWDAYTIAHEPIASIDLMERAAQTAVDWIIQHFEDVQRVTFFCGPGNNGGDGLAMARLLRHQGFGVEVSVLAADRYSEDFSVNLGRLKSVGIVPITISSLQPAMTIAEDALVIDCLFGTGLTRVLEGLAASVVQYVNALPNQKLSIDLPSGLFADRPTPGNQIIMAHYTLIFQCPKLSFFFAEHQHWLGQWHVLDIGLHPGFVAHLPSPFHWVNALHAYVNAPVYDKHAHKGNRGHALLVAGSERMMGAAIMASAACCRSGAGLVTAAVPAQQAFMIQQAVPMAMCCHFDEAMLPDFVAAKKIKAIGIGPGLEARPKTEALLGQLLQMDLPMVIDATALDMLPAMQHLFAERKSATIITPHPGEFDRMAGASADSLERLQKAIALATEWKIFVVLKGAYTRVIAPDGRVYFNNTGNAGMAKGGSGDVLAGLLTGLLAQGMPALDAAIAGVYLHGLAGDMAAQKFTQQAMMPMDMVSCFPDAFTSEGWH